MPLTPRRLTGTGALLVLAAALTLPVSARRSAPPPDQAGGGTMTVDAVMAMPKIDAHAHVAAVSPAQRDALVRFLEAQNLRWLNICVGGMNWPRLQQQIERAAALHRAFPDRIAWATSFNLTDWENPEWAKAATRTIAEGVEGGAVACKVWKDIGMVLQDKGGRYVMIDDPRLAPVLEAVAARGRTLVAHIGEPRNCWLPLESMTTASDRNYFARNPQYHGYLHPEVPGYEKQIAARDAMLERHPKLKVVGCHLGSLEYDVDQLARRLDRYPNLAVDLAARLVHLQIQPREKVRAFVIRYQDRLLYGTDMDFGGEGEDTPEATTRALADLARTYREEARWLATDEAVEVPRAREGFTSKGLALPAAVLRKVYYENAKKWYPGI